MNVIYYFYFIVKNELDDWIEDDKNESSWVYTTKLQALRYFLLRTTAVGVRIGEERVNICASMLRATTNIIYYVNIII